MRIYNLDKGSVYTDVDVTSMSVEAVGMLDSGENMAVIVSPDELRSISDQLMLPEHIISDSALSGESTMFESYYDMNFGVVADISVDPEKFREFMSISGNERRQGSEDSVEFLVERRVAFYHMKRMLIVVRNGNDKSIELFEKRLRTSRNGNWEVMATSAGALFVLLNTITLLDDDTIDDIEDLVESFEESILSGRMAGVASDIMSIRKKLVYLKKKFEPMMFMAEDLVENENGLIPEGGIRLFKLYYTRIERLYNKLILHREYMSELRETYQAQLDISLNNTMKIFTVVTSLVLPLTFITGWFGMNFKHMRILETPYAYEGVMAASVCVVIAGLAYFRSKKLI